MGIFWIMWRTAVYNPQRFLGALILDACWTVSLKSSPTSYCATCITCRYFCPLCHTSAGKNKVILVPNTLAGLWQKCRATLKTQNVVTFAMLRDVCNFPLPPEATTVASLKGEGCVVVYTSHRSSHSFFFFSSLPFFFHFQRRILFVGVYRAALS